MSEQPSDSSDQNSPTSDSKVKSELENATETPAHAPQNLIPSNIASKLPPEVVKTLEFSMTAMAPAPNPFAQQITPDHIHKLIDNAENASVREDTRAKDKLRDVKHSRMTSCIAGLILLVLLAVIWGFLPEKRLESFKELAKDAILLVAGGAGGYGIAMKKLNED